MSGNLSGHKHKKWKAWNELNIKFEAILQIYTESKTITDLFLMQQSYECQVQLLYFYMFKTKYWQTIFHKWDETIIVK